MKIKAPKSDSRYHWTNHSIRKMAFYGISEGVVKRIIRSPKRTEEGIAPDTVGVMQSRGNGKRQYELWVLYQRKNTKTIIISAWRYPGVSPKRKEIFIPEDTLEELKTIS